MAQATHRYLAACFAWMQVRLGFSSLALILVEVQGGGGGARGIITEVVSK
jgi:hypothetical protein